MLGRIINAILYGTVAYILSDAGLTLDTWRFWIVMVSMFAVQAVAFCEMI